LSDKYLTEREELIKKLSDTSQKKKEIRRTISLFNHVLELPERLRDEIQEVRGMTTSQILDLLKQY
jgi:sulfur transfer protein SufE